MTESEKLSSVARSEPQRLSLRTRWLLGVLGAAAFGAGTVAVFGLSGSGGAGAAALLAAGALAIALGGIGVLPTNVKMGAVEVTLPEQLRQYADDALRQGRPDLAKALQLSAELAGAAEPFTQIYESLRTIAPKSQERTIALDALVKMVEQQARQGEWSPSDARTLFVSGQEGARVFALAMMRAFPRAEELDLAEKAVTDPRSSFEQFHALVVIRRMVEGLSDHQRARLALVLDRLELPPHGARARAREAIMDSIGRPARGREPHAD